MPFDGPNGYDVALGALEDAVRPRRALPISEWAGKYRVLSAKNASEPGKWRNDRIPFLAAVMDACDARHPAPLVSFCASSQVGKSESGINWILRTVHQAPASFLALFPTDQVAGKYVRMKLDPAIAATDVIARLIPLGRKANAGNTISQKHYPGGAFITGSAGISNDVAMLSFQYLLLEEVDRMPDELEGEGDPVELAIRRLANFPRSKVFANSTPTTENSRIWKMLLASTFDRYFVPCVHCNALQFLRFSQVKWITGRPAGATYECVACSKAIEERHKTEILSAGHWRATFPEREAVHKGFHINGLYTPIGLGDSWAMHADAWERAQGSLARIQVFWNTRMGEVHKGEKKKVDHEEIEKRAEPYPLRTIPPNVFVLTSFTDVQGDRLETQVLGHGPNEVIHVVDYVVHWGDTSRTKPNEDGELSVWQELDAYLARPIPNSRGVPMPLSVSLVDSGYLPSIVKWFTRPRRARGIYAARGSTNPQKQAIGAPSYPDTKRRGKADKRHGAEVYELGVSELKAWLYEILISDGGTPEKPVAITDRRIHFPALSTTHASLPHDYFRQLTAETWDPKHGWMQRANYHRNEALDTFVGARAAGMHHSIGVHRMTALDWDRYRALYEPEVVPGAPVAPVAVAPEGAPPAPVKAPGRPSIRDRLPTAAITKG